MPAATHNPPTIRLGSSNIFPVTLGGGGEPPKVPADLKGLVPFTTWFIPEPSILGLGVLGGVMFLRRRRR